jgi:hypothetical protein
MKRFIYSAVVGSALLAATAIPSGAATVDLVELFPTSNPVNFSYDVTLSAPGSLSINGFESGVTDFVASLSQGGTTITSAMQAPPSPPFFFSLGPESLLAGTYIFAVTGTSGPGGFGIEISNTGNVSVTPTPIPGSVALFVSGLGLLGFWGWAKGRKAGSGSTSLEAVAC